MHAFRPFRLVDSHSSAKQLKTSARNGKKCVRWEATPVIFAINHIREKYLSNVWLSRIQIFSHRLFPRRCFLWLLFIRFTSIASCWLCKLKCIHFINSICEIMYTHTHTHTDCGPMLLLLDARDEKKSFPIYDFLFCTQFRTLAKVHDS